MLPHPERSDNDHGLSHLQELGRRLLADGATVSEAVARLVEASAEMPSPVPEVDVLLLVAELWRAGPQSAASASKPVKGAGVSSSGTGSGEGCNKSGRGRSSDVTHEIQETQETQETDRDGSRLIETHRGRRRRTDTSREADCQDARNTFQRELESGQPSSLPFADYVRLAVEEHRRHHEARAETPEWESELFYFTRLVRAHPDVRDRKAVRALQAVEGVMCGWRHTIQGEDVVDEWGHWLGVEADDARAEFLDCWSKIDVLPGQSPLESALRKATERPLQLGGRAAERMTYGYGRFISLGGWLAASLPRGRIALPCREVAEVLGVKPMTVSRYRRWAVADGYMTETGAARRGKGGEPGQATEFRFNLDLFPGLTQPGGSLVERPVAGPRGSQHA